MQRIDTGLDIVQRVRDLQCPGSPGDRLVVILSRGEEMPPRLLYPSRALPPKLLEDRDRPRSGVGGLLGPTYEPEEARERAQCVSFLAGIPELA